MMIVGMLLGLGAALFQSTSYLFSRRFVQAYPGSQLHLLALSHVLMGGVSLIMLPFLWPAVFPPLGEFFLPLLGAAGFYLLGQVCLFAALQHSDASRLSPLLGLKVLFLALLGVVALNQSYTGLQWIAVSLTILAAVLLSLAGGLPAWKGLAWILVAIVPYSLSDTNIKMLVEQFENLGLLHASLLSTSLVYILTGVFGIAATALLKRPRRGMWVKSAPFAAAWLISMLFLFATFAVIGVVFGNIMQSTRGLISILLGYGVARMGHIHLEMHITGSVLLQRIAAALLMSGAIALFYLGAAGSLSPDGP